MIVTFYSTKSSTKTSIAVSTAVHFINQGENVTFADLDVLQGSAASWLDPLRKKIKQMLLSRPNHSKICLAIWWASWMA